MNTIDDEKVTLMRPRYRARDWKKTKAGGYYREIGGTRQSVKLAKSNKWFVVRAGMPSEDKWFDEAYEAKAHACLPSLNSNDSYQMKEGRQATKSGVRS